MPRFTLFIGSDHAGLSLKDALKARLQAEGTSDWRVVDVGTNTQQSCDYPDFAAEVARKVGTAALSGDKATLGLLVCGSGIGMSIAANKVAGVRAALVWDVTSARLSREHNDSNVLCMGQRLVGEQVAWDALTAWMQASFAGGRHQGRVDKISGLEKH